MDIERIIQQDHRQIRLPYRSGHPQAGISVDSVAASREAAARAVLRKAVDAALVPAICPDCTPIDFVPYAPGDLRVPWLDADPGSQSPLMLSSTWWETVAAHELGIIGNYLTLHLEIVELKDFCNVYRGVWASDRELVTRFMAKTGRREGVGYAIAFGQSPEEAADMLGDLLRRQQILPERYHCLSVREPDELPAVTATIPVSSAELRQWNEGVFPCVEVETLYRGIDPTVRLELGPRRKRRLTLADLSAHYGENPNPALRLFILYKGFEHADAWKYPIPAPIEPDGPPLLNRLSQPLGIEPLDVLDPIPEGEAAPLELQIAKGLLFLMLEINSSFGAQDIQLELTATGFTLVCTPDGRSRHCFPWITGELKDPFRYLSEKSEEDFLTHVELTASYDGTTLSFRIPKNKRKAGCTTPDFSVWPVEKTVDAPRVDGVFYMRITKQQQDVIRQYLAEAFLYSDQDIWIDQVKVNVGKERTHWDHESKNAFYLISPEDTKVLLYGKVVNNLQFMMIGLPALPYGFGGAVILKHELDGLSDEQDQTNERADEDIVLTVDNLMIDAILRSELINQHQARTLRRAILECGWEPSTKDAERLQSIRFLPDATGRLLNPIEFFAVDGFVVRDVDRNVTDKLWSERLPRVRVVLAEDYSLPGLDAVSHTLNQLHHLAFATLRPLGLLGTIGMPKLASLPLTLAQWPRSCPHEAPAHAANTHTPVLSPVVTVTEQDMASDDCSADFPLPFIATPQDCWSDYPLSVEDEYACCRHQVQAPSVLDDIDIINSVELAVKKLEEALFQGDSQDDDDSDESTV